MNRVSIRAEEVPLPAWTPGLEQFCLAVLDAIGKTNWDLSLVLCDDAFIRELNRNYRDRDEATDVLSFTLGETDDTGDDARYLPGDIIISLETLAENARYFHTSEDEELKRLAVHGILHLDGYDHERTINDMNDGTKPAEPMLALQEQILNQINQNGGINIYGVT
jgi:probable rRNA maturation factor